MITLGKKIIHPIDSTTITKSHLVRTNSVSVRGYLVCVFFKEQEVYMLVWYKFGTVLSRSKFFSIL